MSPASEPVATVVRQTSLTGQEEETWLGEETRPGLSDTGSVLCGHVKSSTLSGVAHKFNNNNDNNKESLRRLFKRLAEWHRRSTNCSDQNKTDSEANDCRFCCMSTVKCLGFFPPQIVPRSIIQHWGEKRIVRNKNTRVRSHWEINRSRGVKWHHTVVARRLIGFLQQLPAVCFIPYMYIYILQFSVSDLTEQLGGGTNQAQGAVTGVFFNCLSLKGLSSPDSPAWVSYSCSHSTSATSFSQRTKLGSAYFVHYNWLMERKLHSSFFFPPLEPTL